MSYYRSNGEEFTRLYRIRKDIEHRETHLNLETKKFYAAKAEYERLAAKLDKLVFDLDNVKAALVRVTEEERVKAMIEENDRVFREMDL
jgi:uncharacterized protein YabN with tetrapyrrole methylase and pyrophosphatase domain